MDMRCVNPGCRIRNRHTQDCPGECTGCLPRPAAGGLCDTCAERLAQDILTAGQAHERLVDHLVGGGGESLTVGGTHDHGLNINDHVITLRDDIRNVLTTWARIVIEERGLATIPDDTPEAIAWFLHNHHAWLAYHQAAGEAAQDFHDLTRRIRGITQPSGTRKWEIAPCPVEDCGGTILAIMRAGDSLLPSALTCNTNPDHTWPAHTWRTLGRRVAAASAA